MTIGKYLNQIHKDKNKEVVIYGGYPMGGKSLLFEYLLNSTNAIIKNRGTLEFGKLGSYGEARVRQEMMGIP